jgi:3'(2'), 5'-bisphosphate nucleotidase
MPVVSRRSGDAQWWAGRSSDKNHDVTAEVSSGGHVALRGDSTARPNAVVARGDHGNCARPAQPERLPRKVWDHAAVLITEEAGQRSDAAGRSIFPQRQLDRNMGIVATNGRLHDRVLMAVCDVLGPR